MENPATPRGECDAIFSGSAPSATRESASSREPRRYCQAPVPHSPSPPPQREALGVSESVRANTRLGPVGKGGPGPLRCCRWWGGTGEDLRGGLALCSTLCCLTLGPKGLLKSPATPIRRRPRPTATRERSPPATVFSMHRWAEPLFRELDVNPAHSRGPRRGGSRRTLLGRLQFFQLVHRSPERAPPGRG